MRLARSALSFVVATLPAAPAAAHVKWFAPYIVDAAPRPASAALADPAFWIGLAFVVLFFVSATVLERHPVGTHMLAGLDWLTAPVGRRLDDVMRAAVAGFFIAVFAVGGVYLTPDLKTPSEAVAWAQLAIALGVFSRATMPLSAAGVVALWLLALRDYALFHLLDYLSLGLGIAAYLVLASMAPEPLRARRFAVLRWAVAISLMWSSLEKFAYPEWFYPLVLEKPFLTFGLPRDLFIPMAGVAEFTLGLGLVWSPLVRRLSALALLVIFAAAVYPFGRMDLIGHALIMAVLVVILGDPARDAVPQPPLAGAILRIPEGVAAAMLVFGAGYWGLHGALYGGAVPTSVAEHATHSPDPDHPHELSTAMTVAPDGSIHHRLD